MSRREAREHIMKLLFQNEFVLQEEYEEQVKNYLEKNEISEKDNSFILKEYEGVVSHEKEIDDLISENSIKWKIPRMAKLDLTILRLAVYEIYYADDIPDNVAINEAVELAKKYSSDEAPAFINGLLANIIKGKQ